MFGGGGAEVSKWFCQASPLHTPLLLSLVCLITKLRFSVVEHSSEQVLLKKASLVLRIHLPMQATWIRSLV